jgi:archaellum component FlaC
MITSEIAANQAYQQVNRANRSEESIRQSSGSDQVARNAKGEAIDGVKTEISAFATLPVQKFNAEFNTIVKSIRIADQAMEEIGTNIEQMEAQVEVFVKQYPPFLPGSEEHNTVVNNFAALRRMIDRLTIPPDPFARELIGPSQGEANVDRWEIKVSGKELSSAIRRQPVHTGREGLNLPALPSDAADGALAALPSQLSQARRTLGQRRADLASDTMQVIRHIQKTA